MRWRKIILAHLGEDWFYITREVAIFSSSWRQFRAVHGLKHSNLHIHAQKRVNFRVDHDRLLCWWMGGRDGDSLLDHTSRVALFSAKRPGQGPCWWAYSSCTTVLPGMLAYSFCTKTVDSSSALNQCGTLPGSHENPSYKSHQSCEILFVALGKSITLCLTCLVVKLKCSLEEGWDIDVINK